MLDSPRDQMYIFEDFMSAEECEKMIAIAEPHMLRSTGGIFIVLPVLSITSVCSSDKVCVA